MKTYRILASIVLVFTLLIPRLDAALVAYEGFGDAGGTELAGSTANSGLGSWTLVSGVSGSATYATPGLSYNSLEVAGNRISFSTGTALYANLSSPFSIGASSVGEFWGSFIMNTSNSSGDAALSLFQNASPNSSTGALATIGMVNSGDARLISGRTMDVNGNNGLVTSTASATQQNFYLFRITIDTNAGAVESGTFWINPTLTSGMGLGDLGAGFSAIFNNTGLDSIAAIGLYTTGTNAAVFDEIRLGTTLADVVPVPEPSTYALLLGITSLAFVVYRRRHKYR